MTGDVEEITQSLIDLTDKKATAMTLVSELRKLSESKGALWEKVQAAGYEGDVQEFLLENFSDDK